MRLLTIFGGVIVLFIYMACSPTKEEKEVIIDIGQGFVMDDLIMSKMIS